MYQLTEEQMRKIICLFEGKAQSPFPKGSIS